MRSIASVPKISPFLLLLIIFPLAGCSADLRKIDLPQNMVSFNDNATKMYFKLPLGWQQSSVYALIEEKTRGIRSSEPIAFQKGDRGIVIIWCDRYDSNRDAKLHMWDVIDTYAPMNELAYSFDVESPGSGWLSYPQVYVCKAKHVVKGEKKEFLIIGVVKEPPTLKMLQECTYVLFGMSFASEYNEEILKDISAIAATLYNLGE